MSADPHADYLDETLPTERRVEDLLSRMTLEEKVAQLTSLSPIPVGGSPDDETAILDAEGNFREERARELLSEGVGHFTRIGGGGGLDPERAAELTDQLQEIVVEESRLGVPGVPHEECLCGYMGPGGTIFPQSMGLASTWEPENIAGMTERIREQMRAIGTEHALSPVLDVARDHRWGRTEETFGEDQTLVAEMANAYIEGLQGDDPVEGIDATIKHFVGHAVGEGGKNRSSVHLGERELREVHMMPFEAAVREAGVESVMNAYHDIDGVPVAKDEGLLTHTLRGEWGFDGTVVSDYFSVRFLHKEHGVAADHKEAAVQALEAGIDVELPQIEVYDQLVNAVKEGELAESTVDRSVERVLRQKFRKGLFEEYSVDADAASEPFGEDVNRDYSRQLARESITLLKNENELLPLSGDEELALVGPKADSETGQLGDYTFPSHYPEKEATRSITTVREAFEAQVGDVTYAEGCTTTGSDTSNIDDAVDAVADADVAVACVGARSAVSFSGAGDDAPYAPTSGEGSDVTDLQLPGVQQELVEAVHETGTPLVVVLVSGKPHAIEWIDEHVPAVAHAWLPGEEGGSAIADVLLGEHNPSGRLPVSVAKNVGQLPVHYSRRPNTASETHVYTDADPLYPFGFGLSYTEFAYGDLELDAEEVAPAGTVEATVTVENTGERAGHEVAQLYVHDRYPELARPVQELVGFQRVELDAGASAEITFEVPVAKLASHDTDMDLVVDPGEFEFRVGPAADDIADTAELDVVGERREVPLTGRAYTVETGVEK